jgi:hypothetical protein
VALVGQMHGATVGFGATAQGGERG